MHKTLTVAATLAALSLSPLSAQVRRSLVDTARIDTVRFATFNASLNRNSEGQLITDLSTPLNGQARSIASIIQRVRPDVVLINEFDFDANSEAADLFRRNYLERSQNGSDPIRYPFVFVAPSNTGIPSGEDLDNNGSTTGPGDAFGFGFFPGQFGMLLLSKYPIAQRGIRTFQNFLWRDMPGALLPDDATTPAPADYYSPAELDIFRLSSKSHWDIPILVGRRVVHALCAHPTPPVFDGPEDRNGRRNNDEIRFWADYVTPGAGDYIYDDNGRTGGLRDGAAFVVLGDYNSDPLDGDSTPGAMDQLLDAAAVNNVFAPRSGGALEASNSQGGINNRHQSNPLEDTADFGDVAPGNLRVDYALPSADLSIVNSGVFWPTSQDPASQLVSASDHRLVWIDINTGRTALEFLGEAEFPTGLMFGGTEVGGLSGIDYLEDFGVYVALSDDRSQINPARYYGLTIDLQDGRLDDGDVNFFFTTPLFDEFGMTFPAASVDPEGIAVTRSLLVLVASEGDANASIDPFVDGFLLAGPRFGSLDVPAKFLTGTAGRGIRNNLAFESLTLSPTETQVFTATENALLQDGPTASLTAGSDCRILRYDSTDEFASSEYIYRTEPIAFPTNPAGQFSTNGLVELLAVRGEGDPRDTLLLALERSFSIGIGNEIRLFAIDLRGADNVSTIDAVDGLQDILRPVRKTLLVDFRTVGIDPDNVEGMTFGPTLPDGRRTLILVSDNNFNAVNQRTQFLAFALPHGI